MRIPAAAAADQLVGRSEPNQTYLGNRLLYEPGESFDLLGGAFLKAMLVEALTVWFASVALAIIPTIFVAVGSANGSGALRVRGGLGLLVAGPGFLIYFWFHRIPVIASEWKLLVDDQSVVADQVFTHITWALRRRKTPVAKMKVRRLSQPRGLSAIISSFGTASSPASIVVRLRRRPLHRLDDVVAPVTVSMVAGVSGQVYLTLTGRGSQLHIIHRYEQAKAMREAMHSAAREGVDAAAGFVAYEGAGTIGSDVEVEVVDSLDNVPGFIAATAE